MSWVKTKYKITGAWAIEEEKTIFAHHVDSVDVITFYDENGAFLFSVEDGMENNVVDAINRLLNPKNEGCEQATDEEIELCKS